MTQNDELYSKMIKASLTWLSHIDNAFDCMIKFMTIRASFLSWWYFVFQYNWSVDSTLLISLNLWLIALKWFVYSDSYFWLIALKCDDRLRYDFWFTFLIDRLRMNYLFKFFSIYEEDCRKSIYEEDFRKHVEL
jgi:hypothetical protein